MLYFAFGSNMLTTRLARRCPSARVVARAFAPGYRAAFDKLSEDTSGKATLVKCDEPPFAVGVVYELSDDDLGDLDGFEGSGYYRQDGLAVTCLDTERTLRAVSYFANKEVQGLRPYDWYLAMVLAGLAENGIGHEHARRLRQVPFDTDPDTARRTRQNALQDLATAGWPDYRGILVSDA